MAWNCTLIWTTCIILYMSLFSRYGENSHESLVVFLLGDYLLLLPLFVGVLFKVLVLFCST